MSGSFRAKVGRFWNTFQKEEASIRKMIDSCDEAHIGMASKLAKSILNIAFDEVNFQIGINVQNKYELILSPEGDNIKLLMLNYWLRQCPEQLLRKWSFHSSMPALPNTCFQIEMFGITLEEKDITLYPSVDDNRSKFDLEIYSPKLLSIDDSARYTLMFIFLDQYISEVYTIEQIGNIAFTSVELNKPVVPLKNLKKEIDRYIETYNWERSANPTKASIGYRRVPFSGEEDTLRREIYEGYTTCGQVIHAYLTKDSEFFKKYNTDGVEFGFFYYNNNETSHSNILTIRNMIELQIAEETSKISIADCIGSAIGKNHSYLDYIIYDYKLFLEIIKQVSDEYDFKNCGFSFFNSERAIVTII